MDNTISNVSPEELLQNKVEAAIETFLKTDKDVNRISLRVLVHDLLGGEPSLWEDDLHIMKKHVIGLTAIITKPEVMKAFNDVDTSYDSEKIGETLTRLIQFFFSLDNSHAKAEIHLGSLECGIIDLSALEVIKNEYCTD